MRVLVIGGGIGGVTAAVALRRAGHSVALFERAREPGEVGAGIVLWGNAVAALRELGAHAPVLACSGVMRQGELRSARGAVLSAQRVEDWDRELGEVSVVVHRAELLQALLAQLPADVVRFGAACSGFDLESGGEAIVARFEDGHVERGDILVGADGIHSVVRRVLEPGLGPPRYAGYTCYRAVVPFADASVPLGYLNETWGRGRRFGLLRLDPARVYWFATLDAPRGERDPSQEVARARLAELFRDWWGPIPALIAATPPAALLRNDILDRAPTRRWGAGRATLLGDAAHPTTPNIGQGACLAIEDALVLARELQRGPTVPAALRRYERARQPRTAEITRFSWWLGRAGQERRAPLAFLRDRLLALTPMSAIRRRHRRYVGFRA